MLSEKEAAAIVRGVGGAIGPKLREIHDELRAAGARQSSTDALLADLDARLAAIEDRFAELNR